MFVHSSQLPTSPGWNPLLCQNCPFGGTNGGGGTNAVYGFTNAVNVAQPAGEVSTNGQTLEIGSNQPPAIVFCMSTNGTAGTPTVTTNNGVVSVCISTNSDCPPVGACCLPGGACELLSQTNCLYVGGNWSGPGTQCTGTPCVVGNCCITNGCATETQFACTNGGGTWYGTNSCPNLYSQFSPSPPGTCTISIAGLQWCGCLPWIYEGITWGNVFVANYNPTHKVFNPTPYPWNYFGSDTNTTVYDYTFTNACLDGASSQYTCEGSLGSGFDWYVTFWSNQVAVDVTSGCGDIFIGTNAVSASCGGSVIVVNQISCNYSNPNFVGIANGGIATVTIGH